MKLLERIMEASPEEMRELIAAATDEELEEAAAALEAKGGDGAAPGPSNWTAGSAAKFAKTVNITDMSVCVSRMKGKVNDPGAFCQAVHKFATGKPNVPGNASEAVDPYNQLAAELELEEADIIFTDLLPESEGRTQLEEAGVVAVFLEEDGGAAALSAAECEELMRNGMKKRKGGDASMSMMEGAPEEIEVTEETHQTGDVSDVEFDDKTMTIRGVTILRPGTSLNNRHYSQEAIQRGHKVFEGTKMYSDHPPKAQAAGPRRISDLMSKVTETWVDAAKGSIKGNVKVFRHDFYEFAKAAADTIGISINALCKGIPNYTLNGQRVDYIQEFVKGHSVDWVTDAGAGGGILVQESLSKEEAMDVLKELTVQELKQERPDLYTEIVQEAVAAKEAAEAERDAAVQELEETKAEVQHQHDLAESNARIRQYLAEESKLPPQAQERVAERFEDIVILEAEVGTKLDPAVKAEKAYIASMTPATGTITGAGPSNPSNGAARGPINSQLDAVLGIAGGE